MKYAKDDPPQLGPIQEWPLYLQYNDEYNLNTHPKTNIEEGCILTQKYIFMTYSDSDLPWQYAHEKNIPVIRMPYSVNGQEYFDDNGRAGTEKDFFAKMRQVATPTTSLLPTAVYLEYFEPILQ